MAKFVPTTPPNTPERAAEVECWMAREVQALNDKLVLDLREACDEARIFREGIELTTRDRIFDMSDCGHREDCAICGHPHFAPDLGTFVDCPTCYCEGRFTVPPGQPQPPFPTRDTPPTTPM